MSGQSIPSNLKFSSITSPRKSKFINKTNQLLSYTIPKELTNEELKNNTIHLDNGLPDYSVENIKTLSLSNSNTLRDEVKALEKFTTMKLHEIHCKYNSNESGSKQKQSLEQIEVLDNTMSQLAKQLESHCLEQSLLIKKIWSSSADLFQSIYHELSSTLSNIQNQLNEKTILCESLQDTLKNLSPNVNENQTQVLLLEKELLFEKMKYHQIYNQLDTEILLKNQELLSLQDIITKISIWFPNFSRFSSSILSDFLPPIKVIKLNNNMSKINNNNEEKELKIANYYFLEDMKRLQLIGNGLVVLDREEYEAISKMIHQNDLIIKQYLKLKKKSKRNHKLKTQHNVNNDINVIDNATGTTSTCNDNNSKNNNDNNNNEAMDNNNGNNNITKDNEDFKIDLKAINELSEIIKNALNRTIYNQNLLQKLKFKKNINHPNSRQSYSEVTADDMMSYQIHKSHRNDLYDNDDNNIDNSYNTINHNSNNKDDDSSSTNSSNSSDNDDEISKQNGSGSPFIQTDMKVNDFYKLQSQRFSIMAKKN